MREFKLKYNIDRAIFRAYDIRGTTPKQLDEDSIYSIGRALGTFLQQRSLTSILVARDGRISSPIFSMALCQGLLEAGINVIDIGLCTSPLLYFATTITENNTGVIITGSHNPKDDNGLKIVVQGKSLTQEELLELHQLIITNELSKGKGTLTQESFYEDYIKAICNRVNLDRKLKLVIDCGNGAAGIIAKDVFESLGATVIVLYEEVDGRFPNHQPDPSVPQNLIDLQKAVVENNADLGLAFDGDADRVGAVDELGESIFSDRLLMLLSEHLLKESPGSSIVYDIKCSKQLPELIGSKGGKPILSPTGHSLVKAKMKDMKAALAGEMSGHIFYQNRWFGFDDGVYTGARLAEILSKTSRSFSGLMKQYPKMLSTPEIKIAISATQKFVIIKQLEKSLSSLKGAKLTTIDGVRIEFADGWALVRASNTTEHLTLRFEAENETRLMSLMTLLRSSIQQAEESLDLTALA